QRDTATVRRDQTDREGNMEWEFGILPRSWRARLGNGDHVAFCRRVVAALYIHNGRSRLLIPAFELCQIRAGSILHGLYELVGTHCLAIVALEIQVHALAKVLRSDEGVDHAYHLRAFLVNRSGVEIADFHIGGGAHRMRHRAGILRELCAAQRADLLDALHGARIAVGAILLVTEYR